MSVVLQEKDSLQETINDLTNTKSELADNLKALESELAGAQEKCKESEIEKLVILLTVFSVIVYITSFDETDCI